MSRWVRGLCAAGIVLVFSVGFYLFFIRPYAYRWKPCHGQKGYGVCIPCNYEVHGVDVSHYQGAIDWGRVAADSLGDFPLRFVFMKATEGGDHGDTTFLRHFEEARRARAEAEKVKMELEKLKVDIQYLKNQRGNND